MCTNKDSTTHWTHDVVATLKQRQWRWFNVVTTSYAQWVGNTNCVGVIPKAAETQARIEEKTSCYFFFQKEERVGGRKKIHRTMWVKNWLLWRFDLNFLNKLHSEFDLETSWTTIRIVAPLSPFLLVARWGEIVHLCLFWDLTFANIDVSTLISLKKNCDFTWKNSR